ncbi:Zinc-regulated transporter 2 [Hypsizygus marmoreus]|uniref:Zinc-regulated transporter 2 n=1 Tax=Hypsizygus marmoreus TaxID=39966 RepID=A0A369JNY5_HYPMA|nr:Zinc-regulated transporter 2 [Hypsizygus marmoreus]
MPVITSTVLYDGTVIVEGSDLPRIGAMLGILFVSLFAISFPGISKQTPSLRIPHLVFFIGKHFGTGAILSTAFCHLLPDAFESLQDRGVNERYHGIGKWTGMIILGSLLSIFLVEYISTSYVDHLHADPSAPPSPSSTRAPSPSPSPSRISIPKPQPPTTQIYYTPTTALLPSIPLHRSPNPPLVLPTPPTPTPTETTPLVPKSHCTATHTHPHAHNHTHNQNHNQNHNHNHNQNHTHNLNHNHNNHTHTHNDSEPLLPLFLLSSPRLFWKRSTPHFPAVLGWGRAAGDVGCVCERNHMGCVEEEGGDEDEEREREGEGERQREEGISEWVREREGAGAGWEGDMDIRARERGEIEDDDDDDDEKKSPKVGRRRQVVGILVLQLGIMIHSLVIGLTLAVTAGPEFTSLVTAIIFHQLFEGLSLGIRIASLPPPPSPPPPSTPSPAPPPSPPSPPSSPPTSTYAPLIPERQMPYPPRPTPTTTPHAKSTKPNKHNNSNKSNKSNKSWLTPVLAILFAITTPAGMGLGSLVFDASASSSVPEGDPEQAARIRLTQGIMSGVSAGMLIYAATVEMLAGDFVFGDVGGDVGVDWEGEVGHHEHDHHSHHDHDHHDHDHFKHHHPLHSNHSHHTRSLNHNDHNDHHHHHHHHHHEEESEESDTGTIDSIIIHARDLDHGGSKRRGAVWRKVVAVVSLLGGAGAMALVGMGE